jgi:hypothetical protein
VVEAREIAVLKLKSASVKRKDVKGTTTTAKATEENMQRASK